MLAQPGDNMLKGSQTPSAGHRNPSLLWARTFGMLHHELTRSNTSTTSATLPSVLDHDALNRAIWSLANSGPDKGLNAGNLAPNGLDSKALERTDAHGCCMGLATFGPNVGHVSLGLPRFLGDLALMLRKPMFTPESGKDPLGQEGARVLGDANPTEGATPECEMLGDGH